MGDTSVKFKPKKRENAKMSFRVVKLEKKRENAKKKTTKKRENFNLIVNFMKFTTRKMKSNIFILL